MSSEEVGSIFFIGGYLKYVFYIDVVVDSLVLNYVFYFVLWFVYFFMVCWVLWFFYNLSFFYCIVLLLLKMGLVCCSSGFKKFVQDFVGVELYGDIKYREG